MRLMHGKGKRKGITCRSLIFFFEKKNVIFKIKQRNLPFNFPYPERNKLK